MAMQFDVRNASVSSTGTLVAFRTRIKGLLVTPTATAGSVVLKDGGASGSTEITITTAANAAPFSVLIPGDGVLFETNVHATLTDVAAVSAFYG